MHENARDMRIVALDLRLQRFGYAVLDRPHKLLDWGIKTYRATDNNTRAILAGKRIIPLLTMFRPSVIVASHVSGLNTRKGSGHYQIVRTIEHEGRERSAELILLGRDEMLHAFGTVGEPTKDGIAAQVALFLPDLTWKLPPVRKTWASEHHNIPIFDAAALGLTYLARFGDIFSAGVQSPGARSPG